MLMFHQLYPSPSASTQKLLTSHCLFTCLLVSSKRLKAATRSKHIKNIIISSDQFLWTKPTSLKKKMIEVMIIMMKMITVPQKQTVKAVRGAHAQFDQLGSSAWSTQKRMIMKVFVNFRLVKRNFRITVPREEHAPTRSWKHGRKASYLGNKYSCKRISVECRRWRVMRMKMMKMMKVMTVVSVFVALGALAPALGGEFPRNRKFYKDFYKDIITEQKVTEK